jgi:hypothetical protein
MLGLVEVVPHGPRLPPLSHKKPKTRGPCGDFFEADARTRTGDPFITSEVLYQLSYVGLAGQYSPAFAAFCPAG